MKTLNQLNKQLERVAAELRLRMQVDCQFRDQLRIEKLNCSLELLSEIEGMLRAIESNRDAKVARS